MIKTLLITILIICAYIAIQVSNNRDVDRCVKNKNGMSKETCEHLLDR